MKPLIFLLFSPVLLQHVEYEIDKEECKQVGFNSDTLKCRSCEKLSEFHLEELMTDCMKCCTKEQEFEHEKYPLAILEVCECNLGRFPQVQAFVHKDMAVQWNGKVKVRHVRGVRPQIKLKDGFGITKETLNVEQWDTDTITDFFNQWLE